MFVFQLCVYVVSCVAKAKFVSPLPYSRQHRLLCLTKQKLLPRNWPKIVRHQGPAYQWHSIQKSSRIVVFSSKITTWFKKFWIGTGTYVDSKINYVCGLPSTGSCLMVAYLSPYLNLPVCVFCLNFKFCFVLSANCRHQSMIIKIDLHCVIFLTGYCD